MNAWQQGRAGMFRSPLEGFQMQQEPQGMHCDCTVYTTQIKQPWETHLGHRGTNTVTQEFSTSFICCKTSKVHQNQRLTLKGSPKSERTRPRADGKSPQNKSAEALRSQMKRFYLHTIFGIVWSRGQKTGLCDYITYFQINLGCWGFCRIIPANIYAALCFL